VARHTGPEAVRVLRRGPSEYNPLVRAARLACGDLGATYVKFGQFVGSAPDIVGEGVADEFRFCLDSGPPIPFDDVRNTIEAQLGKPLRELFADIDDQPVAAASIAAVHRARLRTGEEVAVKVLRPGMEQVVAADLALISAPVKLAARQGVDQAMDLLSYLIGLREQVAEELDLRNEARSMQAFRQVLSELDLNLIVVPKVYEELSSRRVLTMELLDGVPLDDFDNIARMGHDARPLVRQLMQAWILTAARFGAFHADIHAGNLLLLRDGRLGMLDWGIICRLDGETYQLMVKLFEAAIGIEDAWDEMAEHFLRIQGASLQGGLGLTDEESSRLLRNLIEPIITQPVGEVRMSTLFGSSADAIALARGEAPPRKSLRERWRLNRLIAETNRLKIQQGVPENATQRASFLAAKQLVYLERYWKMYLPEEPLLGDHDFLRAVLRRD
jgi:predicted unusual protein kinase regulating ubiquinone biosynthesis (AarF/ABC1/UbiB family)